MNVEAPVEYPSKFSSTMDSTETGFNLQNYDSNASYLKCESEGTDPQANNEQAYLSSSQNNETDESNSSTKKENLCFNPQRSYNGSVGNDMGVSTVGYRSSRYNMPEWKEATYAKFRQALADRSHADVVKHHSRQTVAVADERARHTQTITTNRVAARLKDIKFWREELEREIKDMLSEIKILGDSKMRLEKALRSCEIILMVTTDNLNVRELRDGIDLVQDDVELNLLMELEITNNVMDILKRAIRQAEEQLKRNKDRKYELEFDWSDKSQSTALDSEVVMLRDHHTNKQYYAGVARFQETQSTPESWAQFSHDNLVRSERERLASIQLKNLNDQILESTSKDLMEQSEIVGMLLRKRILELEETKIKLLDNLKETCQIIYETEKNIDHLRDCISRKEETLKVAQTRLKIRESRPNVELVRDPPQYYLICEVNELSRAINLLAEKMNQSEEVLKDLQDQRMAIEKDIARKEHSIFIDRDKCLVHRNRFPSRMQLLGFH